VVHPAAVEQAVSSIINDPADRMPVRERLASDLADYQSGRYAAKFAAVVASVEAAGSPAFTDVVARNLYKLMAYKDEYEVARLLLLPESRAAAEAVGGPGAKVVWHLHPPLLRALGMKHKIRLGSWARPVFVLLRAGRRVRGTPLDVFGWARVRRIERAMIGEYVDAVHALLRRLPTDDHAVLAEAIAIAGLPDQVRGYERLKLQRAAVYRAELHRRVRAFSSR
jgi:indolepyruvate ferredoxin oxidoreductase